MDDQRFTDGREADGSAPERSAPAGGGRPEDDAIRVWARANGHLVNDRGRIPSAIRAAYEQARAAAPEGPEASAP